MSDVPAGIRRKRHLVGVIALVPDPWIDRWSTRHQVLTRLAERYTVVWMNPPHEWPEIPLRLQGGPTWSMPLADRPGFHVYSPESFLPKLYRPYSLSRWAARRRLARARAWLLALGCERIVLSVWNPQFSMAFENVQHDVGLYHVDDEYSFSDVETPVSEAEHRLLANADQVFVHSNELLEKRGQYAKRVTFTPNGVDYQLYSTRGEEPVDLRDIPHPRIGYTGYIKRQIDWELVHQLASRHPEWSFVLVGARSPHPDIDEVLGRLDALPNVYSLGDKTTTELAAYPAHFDVCVMPYRVSAYTRYINPLKLQEYLAAGRPCIGPPLPALQGVPEVMLASTLEEWEHAITHALGPDANSAERVMARQALARTKDWGGIVKRIADVIDERVEAADRAARRA
jgi:glycosyltransferase involved in cell wall biosynthesis